MEEKYKEVYFVTLVIKYTKVKMINNLPMRHQNITVYSEIKKGIPEFDAYNKTLENAQKKFTDGMQVIAYTVTVLTEDIFKKEKESEVKNEK